MFILVQGQGRGCQRDEKSRIESRADNIKDSARILQKKLLLWGSDGKNRNTSLALFLPCFHSIF